MTLATPVHRVAPGIALLARLGYAAKGVVYVVIGALAARGALGAGGATTDQRGALEVIGGGPFGAVALVLIAVGLLGYMAWRLVAAVTDAEGAGDDPTSLGVRIAQGARGVAYGALGVYALKLLTNRGGSGSGGATRHWTATLLDMPFGRALVLLVALGIIGYAGYQIWRASSQEKVRRHLDLAEAGSKADVVVQLGQFGIAARAIVFTLMGVFFLRAAREADASEAGGMADSLNALVALPFGRFALMLVALGLVAYGIYQIATARYRHVRV